MDKQQLTGGPVRTSSETDLARADELRDDELNSVTGGASLMERCCKGTHIPEVTIEL